MRVILEALELFNWFMKLISWSIALPGAEEPAFGMVGGWTCVANEVTGVVAFGTKWFIRVGCTEIDDSVEGSTDMTD